MFTYDASPLGDLIKPWLIVSHPNGCRPTVFGQKYVERYFLPFGKNLRSHE
jgi:hypothetical protein